MVHPGQYDEFTLRVSVWEDPPPEDEELVVTAISSNSQHRLDSHESPPRH